MHVSQLKESKFLKRADVGTGALMTMTGLTQENVAKEGADPENKWCLHFEETEKPFVLNPTNIELIKEIHGEETDDWMGKTIVIYDDPNVFYAGKKTGGLRVRAPKVAGPKAGKPVFKQEEDEPPF